MCLAIPGRVLTISGDDPLLRSGRIDFGGIIKEINLSYTPEARTGDYVLAHVGFAMAVIDEAEAQRVLETLRELASRVDPQTRDTAPPRAGAAGRARPP
jgi:hydrogenase expression/formation protein HypC